VKIVVFRWENTILAEDIYSKEKESSHMHRLTIKNLSSLVGKLSSSIEDNVVERRTERQMSSSPVTGYTPGYKGTTI
jgi:hypothetical protein